MFSVCVFCGSAAGQSVPASPPGPNPWLPVAVATGRLLASQGWRLVYGGGKTGLMGALANACLAAGGEVMGIMPTQLVQRERAHSGLQQLEVVSDLATRKARMIAESDCFLTLPGGLGTLDELFEVLTWQQLNLHQKPSVILNAEGLYTPLKNLFKAQQEAGFIHSPATLYWVQDAESLQARLQQLAEHKHV